MARNRVFYQSESVFAGPAGATGVHVDLLQGSLHLAEENNGIKRLQRIQSANYSFTVDRTDVNQFGELAAIDRIILTSPTVSMDFSYILANVANESILGFKVDGSTSAITNIIDKTKDERNYFIKYDNIDRFLKNYEFICNKDVDNDFFVNVLANKKLKSDFSYGFISKEEFFNKVKGY